MTNPSLPTVQGSYSDSAEWLAKLNKERHGVPYTVRVCDFCRPQDLMSHQVRRYFVHVNSGFYMSACQEHITNLDAAWDGHKAEYQGKFPCCDGDR